MERQKILCSSRKEFKGFWNDWSNPLNSILGFNCSPFKKQTNAAATRDWIIKFFKDEFAEGPSWGFVGPKPDPICKTIVPPAIQMRQILWKEVCSDGVCVCTHTSTCWLQKKKIKIAKCRTGPAPRRWLGLLPSARAKWRLEETRPAARVVYTKTWQKKRAATPTCWSAAVLTLRVQRALQTRWISCDYEEKKNSNHDYFGQYWQRHYVMCLLIDFTSLGSEEMSGVGQHSDGLTESFASYSEE